MLQLVLGTLFAAILLFIQALSSPYVATSDNYLASASSFSVVIVLLSFVGFKNAALVDLPDIQEKMSREQKDVYLLDTGLLTTVLFLSVLSSLVVATVIFFFQLAAETARRHGEARASSARRLRYVSDDREVELGPPAIPEKTPTSFEPTYQMGAVSGRFHIFLSHVWGTGQVRPHRTPTLIAPSPSPRPHLPPHPHSHRTLALAPIRTRCASSSSSSWR